MLLITGNDEGSRPRVLTVERDRSGNATLRIYEQTDSYAGLPMGTLLASFRLDSRALTELKRSL